MATRLRKRKSPEKEALSNSSTATTSTATTTETAVVTTTNDENFEVDSFMKAKLEAWLAEFDLEVATRCRALRTQAEDEATVLRRELDIQLMKFSKRARSLTVAEFCSDYQGSVLLASAVKPPASVLASFDAAAAAQTTASTVVPATPRAAIAAAGGGGGAVAFRAVGATPLSERSQQKQRELALLAAKRRCVVPFADFNLQLKTTSGAPVDLSSINQNKAAKDATRAQIRLLQEKLDGMMATLNSPQN